MLRKIEKSYGSKSCGPDWKYCNEKAYSCPRGVSGHHGGLIEAALKTIEHLSTIVSRGFREWYLIEVPLQTHRISQHNSVEGFKKGYLTGPPFKPLGTIMSRGLKELKLTGSPLYTEGRQLLGQTRQDFSG